MEQQTEIATRVDIRSGGRYGITVLVDVPDFDRADPGTVNSLAATDTKSGK